MFPACSRAFAVRQGCVCVCSPFYSGGRLIPERLQALTASGRKFVASVMNSSLPLQGNARPFRPSLLCACKMIVLLHWMRHDCRDFLENKHLWLMWALFQVWRWLLLMPLVFAICNAINNDFISWVSEPHSSHSVTQTEGCCSSLVFLWQGLCSAESE